VSCLNVLWPTAGSYFYIKPHNSTTVWITVNQWWKWTEGSGGTTLLLYFAFALVHDSQGIEIVNVTISLALSAGTLMASAGTPYHLVPAHFYPCCKLYISLWDELWDTSISSFNDHPPPYLQSHLCLQPLLFIALTRQPTLSSLWTTDRSFQCPLLFLVWYCFFWAYLFFILVFSIVFLFFGPMC